MKYRPEIDGLRALAVIPVIFFHAGFENFKGGFIGVDIFFVISGYLIASIILEEKHAQKFTLINFYERRARRILPALFFVMILCIPFAWFWMLQEDLVIFSKSLIFVTAFSSNILFWKTSSYFQALSELNPLLHTWSLAIEEQFYLIFPLFLIIFWRLGLLRIFIIILILTFASLTLAQWGAYNRPSANFFLLPTRIWELFSGVLISFYIIKKKNITNHLLSESLGAAGLLLLLFSFFFFDKNSTHPSLYTVIPISATMLIILFVTSESFVGKLLGSKLFISVGLISYSLYLWHQPIFAFSRIRSYEELNNFIKVGLIVLTFFLSYFSWKYIELPFRNKKTFNQKKIFKIILFFIILLWSIGGVFYYNNGFAARLKLSIDHKEISFPNIDNGWCFYGVDDNKNLKIGVDGTNCWIGDSSSKIKGLLIGDSYAGHYEPFWDKVGKDSSFAINAITTNYCFPSLDDIFPGPKESPAIYQCLYNRKFILNKIVDYDFVILAGSWGAVDKNNNINNVFNLIDYLAPKVKVIVIMPSPKNFDENVLRKYKKSVKFNQPFDISKVPSSQDSDSVFANGTLEKFSKKYKNIIFVDRNSIFLANGNISDLTSKNIPFSYDGSHLNIHGSKSAAENFLMSKKYSFFIKMLNIE
jgi:hypothetical protein